MKYSYAYKSSDGERHVGKIDATSREEVFEILRKQGIKAIKVVAEDGSKANGAPAPNNQRYKVYFILMIAVLIGIIIFLLVQNVTDFDKRSRPALVSAQSDNLIATPLPRQAIQGNRRVIETLPDNFFSSSVEKYLSNFAEPGRRIDFPLKRTLKNDKNELIKILKTKICYSTSEHSEYIDLKRITAGLKKEMLDFILAGNSQEMYLEELVNRQKTEISYRSNASKKLNALIRSKQKGEIFDYWVKANAQLQSMGIYPLPPPDILKEYQIPIDLE